MQNPGASFCENSAGLLGTALFGSLACSEHGRSISKIISESGARFYEKFARRLRDACCACFSPSRKPLTKSPQKKKVLGASPSMNSVQPASLALMPARPLSVFLLWRALTRPASCPSCSTVRNTSMGLPPRLTRSAPATARPPCRLSAVFSPASEDDRLVARSVGLGTGRVCLLSWKNYITCYIIEHATA